MSIIFFLGGTSGYPGKMLFPVDWSHQRLFQTEKLTKKEGSNKVSELDSWRANPFFGRKQG